MVGRQIAHEWLLIRRSSTALAALALMAGVTAFALANGAAAHREQRARLSRIQAHDRDLYTQIKVELGDLERRGDPHASVSGGGMVWYLLHPDGEAPPAPNLDPRRPESASSEWVGARHALLWPRPLAWASVGQSDLFPNYSRVTIRTKPMLVASDELENPLNLLNGRFDLAFVVAFCLPLLMLPITYDLLAGERERGTLALVRSHPVSLRTVLGAKLLVCGGLCVAAVGGTTLVVSPLLSGELGTDGLGLLLLLGVIVAQTIFWLGAAALANVRATTGTRSAATLVAAWMLTTVIAPALVSTAVVSAVPVPSRVHLIAGIREAGNLPASETKRVLDAYLRNHPEATLGADAHDAGAIRGLALQDETDRRTADVRRAYADALREREALAARSSWVAPALMVQDAFGEVAGTSSTRYRRFGEQLEAFHAEWRAHFYPLVHRHAQLTARAYDEFPSFAFREEAAPLVHGRVAAAVGVLLVAGLTLIAAAMRALRFDGGGFGR